MTTPAISVPLDREADHTPDKRRWPRMRWAAAALVLVALAYPAASVVGALRTPGNDGFEANWADWMRGHQGTWVANHLEAIYFEHHRPSKGGAPRALNRVPSTASFTVPRTLSGSSRPGSAPALPAMVRPVVSSPLPGEGVWRATGPMVDGRPTMEVAQFRADRLFTAELTTAVWMDPTRLRLSLIPGTNLPGGHWPHPPYVTTAEESRAVATFNSGFRMQDSRGGFYEDGKAEVPLRKGAASLVIYDNGRVDVGSWGGDVHGSSHVRAVRQNLVLLVDHGRLNPNATYNDNKIWGNTPGVAIVEPRSGIGVTADGALVFVSGPALTAKTLGESLQRAGAVRAMTLDMNPTWVTFNLLTHPKVGDPSFVVAKKLYPQMDRGADRYLGPSRPSTRDFFLVSLP